MKRKILALLLSLAMLLSIGGMVEGTLAVGISVDSTRSSVTLGEVDPPVTPTPEGTPEATPAPTEEPTPAPTEEPTPAPTEEPEATPTPTVEPTPAPEEEAGKTGDALFAYLMEQDTPESLIKAIKSVTQEQAATLTEQQIKELDAHFNQVIPPVDTIVGDTLVAGDETVTGPSEVRIPTYDFTDAAPFGAPAKGTLPNRLYSFRASAAPLSEEQEDNGMKTEKTFAFNPDSTTDGIITLEAWATGEFTQTSVSKQIPTDIILVLDQSGSMKEAFDTITEKSYKKLDNTNMQNYPLRQNGGSDNLWYRLADGSFVRVNMTLTQNIDEEQMKSCISYHFPWGDVLWNSDMVGWSDAGQLYQKLDDGTYARCYVTRTFGGYDYHYADGTTEHVTYGSNPKQVSADRFFHAEGILNTYRYFYVDSHGNEVTIETREGDSTKPTETFYSLITTTTDRTKLKALQDAVKAFAAAVAEKAKGDDPNSTEDDVNHRIAVVGFASGDKWNGQEYNYQNTEVFIGSQQNTYGNAAKGVYATAFMDMDDPNDVTNVGASVDALDSNGGTLTHLGLEMANGIFNANPISAGTERNRVVIVFTDGQPGWSGYDSDIAKDALTQANTAKNTNGATVYTVGIFEGANVNGTDSTNTFMRNMASSGDGYYLTASNSDALNKIFKNISENIQTGGSKTTLDAETVIKDVMSDSFRLPDGAQPENIRVYTAAVDPDTGEFLEKVAFADAQVAVDSESQTVSVTNFNFSENWVGTRTVDGVTTYGGKKLIIEIPCTVRNGFLGGNNVYTNAGAGVYENSSATDPVLTFPRPQVNVPIQDVAVTAADKNVYLLSGLTADELKSGATVTVGGVELKLNETKYGLADWQTEYVDITVEVKDANDTVVTGLTDLAADTTYTISVTVAPKTNGVGAEGTPATAKTGANDPAAKINVFKPELTFKDSTAYYGEAVPANNDYSSNKVGSEVWKHGDITSTDEGVTMLGTKPSLEITYTPDSSKIVDDKYTKQDVPVKATVKIGTDDVSAYTTFIHQDCADETWTGTNGDPAFMVHIKTCQLTITKTGGTDGEPYVFTVYKDGAKYTEATIVGNDSVIIYELPVGTYTIAEDTGWSWRFSPSYGSAAELSATNSTGTVTCTNTLNKPYWLNGFSEVVKNVFGIKH